MKAGLIPALINDFNVYRKGKRIGIMGEMELPELESVTDTISAAGVAGEIERPATGHFGSLKTKLKFALLNDDYFALLNTNSALELTLRADGEYADKKTGNISHLNVKVVVKGYVTNANLGGIEQGKKGEAEVEIETIYLKVVIGGEEKLELDKLNYKYAVNGKDLFAKIRKNI